MTTSEIDAWWKSLSRDERSRILVEWPQAHGLSLDSFALVPEHRRSHQPRPDVWIWRIPSGGSGEGQDRVGSSQEFADFLHDQVEKPFRHDETA